MGYVRLGDPVPGNWLVAALVAASLVALLVNLAFLALVVRTAEAPRRLARLRHRENREPPRTESTPRPPRTRGLFVADGRFPTGEGRNGDAFARGPRLGDPRPDEPRAIGAGPMRRSLSESLPADLAELLATPAPVVSRPEGPAGIPPLDGPDRVSTSVTRLPLSAEDLAAGLNGLRPVLDTDATTGLEGPAGWSRLIEIENARLLRYRRPVTIIMAEVEGLRRLGERVGHEPVQRLLPVIADAFRREARGSDWVARVGEARFAALLPETDEIQAINYVERVRIVCEPWLASAAVPMRLAIGWSSPAASGDLTYAVARAEERMHADRRVAGKALPPRVMNARVVSLPPADPTGEPLAAPRDPRAPEAADADGTQRPGDGTIDAGAAAGERTSRHRRRPQTGPAGPASP